MKKLFFFIVVLLFVCSNTNAQTIVGKIENGVGKITIAETVLKTKWENYLKSNRIINPNLSDFVIKKVSDGTTFFIVCKDNTVRNGLTSSYGIELTSAGSNGLDLAVGGGTCTCTGSNGCTMGCDPKQYANGDWYCTFCADPAAVCDKSVTKGSASSCF